LNPRPSLRLSWDNCGPSKSETRHYRVDCNCCRIKFVGMWRDIEHCFVEQPTLKLHVCQGELGGLWCRTVRDTCTLCLKIFSV
jgi:hypothetical protein